LFICSGDMGISSIYIITLKEYALGIWKRLLFGHYSHS